jgi:dipeptidyl aminopeptidase/acylaminoacyl peptidase
MHRPRPLTCSFIAGIADRLIADAADVPLRLQPALFGFTLVTSIFAEESMRRLLACLLPVLALFVSLLAQQAPLLDRELFFGDPEISGAQLSPDGKYMAFIKPWNQTRNIWVKRTEEAFDQAKLVTADTKRPIPGYFWSRDGKYILFVQDQGGDENYNVHAVNPSDPAAPGSEAPRARNLTEATGVRTFIHAVPESDPDSVYVGLNDRDKAWHDLYRVKISTGERTLVRTNTERLVGWVFDQKDDLRLALRSTDAGETEILRVDPQGFKKIYSCNVFESCNPIAFHKDNRRVYMATNQGDEIDLSRLVLLDPRTGKTELVESDPLKRVDFGGAIISELTDELIATIYTDDRSRIYWKNKAYEADYRLLQKQLGDKEIRFASHTRDERLWLISASSDTEPGETLLFDRQTKKITPQYRIREKLPREHLAAMKPIRYPSSDGTEIPGFLTLPKGVEARNLPLVVMPHGGPWARDNWGYSGGPQFLANRGYAVLQPNFRASTGYGKKFLNAGNLQWGDKMQDDITWGVKYLVQNGIVDPKRVGIMGGSYGGYATLAGVAFTPDLYAAGVAIVAPSNLITLLETIPPYWEAGRTLFYKRMGDPGTPEGREQLERQSPLRSADKIKSPLLVVQGANDPRVNKRESDQIVIALRDRGFPVEYLVAPDEGHGFARPVNNMAMFASAERFLAKHLGGRHQEGGTPEVMARLAEITVDPTTVVLATTVDAASVGIPKAIAGLVAGAFKFAGTLQVGEHPVKLEIATEITETEAGWSVTETVAVPMGQMTDTTVLDKSSLTVLRRSVQQGPASVELQVEGNQATGKMIVGGQETPLEVDLGGPLFADGAGSSFALAALPLAEGYAVTFRNLDVQQQKVKLMQLKVTGMESVSVPAGTFDAYRVEISSADGGNEKATLWVARDSRKPVKMSTVLTQMGGAVLTVELQ